MLSFIQLAKYKEPRHQTCTTRVQYEETTTFVHTRQCKAQRSNNYNMTCLIISITPRKCRFDANLVPLHLVIKKLVMKFQGEVLEMKL